MRAGAGAGPADAAVTDVLALRRLWEGGLPHYDAAVLQRSADAVAAVVASGRTVYGINTGFGALARRSIAASELAELQRRLVLSHAAGVGALLPAPVVRFMMALKVVGLARGFSGVRPAVVALLRAMIEAGVVPAIPGQGSVGASGDLAPLAHLAAAMIGEGFVVAPDGALVPAAAALAAAGLQPVVLAPKEGLALLNGTQASTALALAALFRAEDVFRAALVTGALSVDAARGSDTPFDARIHGCRGHRGQIDVAVVLRRLLAGSGIRASHAGCDRVQDPYSLRCQPQVMGACLDSLRHIAGVLEIEANAVTDNPLIFENGDVLSGGNFHAEPVALVADAMAVAIAEIGAMAERRVALLTDPAVSQLPAFLVATPGIDSGFMIAHVTAAALASENKQRAAPVSVDSLPTSANQEDHVSMATHGARRLHDMLDNLTHIVAIEWLAAAQGISLLAPLETSPVLAEAVGLLRSRVPALAHDRLMAPDIAAAASMLREGRLGALVTETLL